MKKQFHFLKSAYVLIALFVPIFSHGIGTHEAEKAGAAHHQIQQHPDIPEPEYGDVLIAAPLPSPATTTTIVDSAPNGSASITNDIAVVLKSPRKELPLQGRIASKIIKKKMEKQMKKKRTKKTRGRKSQVVALLLCIFLGTLGIHRFYLGYTGAGIIQLLTGGLFYIWTFIDFIRILTGALKPKKGEYDKTF